MNENKIRIELDRVGKALRESKVVPDFFIFIDDKDWTYDEDKLFGIPVYHLASNVNYTPYGDSDLSFIPCWKGEFNSSIAIKFERAYDNN